MSVPSPRPQNVEDIVSKPNRAAIIRTLGERGELSFKELKANMRLGVGTLYYHLDGLTGLVTQNGTRQYVLTDQGRQVYESIKGIAQTKEVRRVRLPSLRTLLGEVLLFDSHVERLPIDSMSDISIALGILLSASVLAGMTRIDDAVFFILGRATPSTFALITVFISWSILFIMGSLLAIILWRSNISLSGMAGGSALSLVPVMFAMLLEGLRRTFAPSLAFLNSLYVVPGYLIFQAVLVVWGAYIYTVSVRSASNLSLEKALVVVLVVVLVNLGYLWARPVLLPVR